MDKITTSILEEFVSDHKLPKLKEEEQFEHLAAFLTIRRHYSRPLDTNAVVVGKGGDTGLDAIATIVNGSLITDPDEVDELLEANGYIEATFIFVQAERTAGFDGAKIGTIGTGVVDFFSDSPQLVRNQRVTDAADIQTAVYNRASKFRRPPACRIYYVTTGIWTDPPDKNLEARRNVALYDLHALKMFDEKEIDFTCYGAAEIHRQYQNVKNAVERTFVFKNKLELPPLPNVELSLLGYIPAKEFLGIISDNAGDDILGSIFYDNVRDWQDYNEVNTAIRDTIASDKQPRFVLMNNGITIVTRELKQSGSNITLTDFQIVNGCQTSNVIFDQREHLTDVMMIPLRLIATKDEDVKESITFGTNSQTELKPEQLYARTEFAKNLERYFVSFTKDGTALYYERRDGQYDRLAVEKGRIVSPQTQIKTFAAMFLNEPHTATKNYKSLRMRVGQDIFVKEHQLAPYYVAAFVAYKLELQYRSQKVSANYKSARYHLLLAMRLLMDSKPLPPMNSKEMDKRCGDMMKLLWDASRTDTLFQKAKEVIDKVSNGDLSRDNIRTKETADSIVDMLKT